jgi:hypothetical protein
LLLSCAAHLIYALRFLFGPAELSAPLHGVTINGLDSFLTYLDSQARVAPPGFAGAAWFVLRIGEDCAHIKLQDVWIPLRFLRQMAAHPPLRFAVDGFCPDLVDDQNPARHYVAFVFLGFWLPRLLALLLLYAWEAAGFLRYGLRWSQCDVRCGLVGLRHGAWVRRCGPTVLPALVAGELGPCAPTSPARLPKPIEASRR